MYSKQRFYDNSFHTPLPLWFLSLYFVKRSWLHCNPSNKNINRPEYLKHYIFSPDKIAIENKNGASDTKTISSYENIKQVFCDGGHKYLFIYGNKGYGKTTIQNYILMTHSKKLNNDNITWLRIDIAKIYAEWEGLRYMSLLRYLYIQIVYIYIRYHQDMGDSYDHDGVFEAKSSDIQKELESQGLLTIFNQFKEKIISSNTKHNKRAEKNYLNSYDNIQDTVKIAKTVLKHLAQNMILILDGIDNVDYSNDYRGDIQKQLGKILSLSKNKEETRLFNFKKIVIFLRNENRRFFKEILDRQEREDYNNINLAEEKNLKNIPHDLLVKSFVVPNKHNNEDLKDKIPEIKENILSVLKSTQEIPSVQEDTQLSQPLAKVIKKIENCTGDDNIIKNKRNNHKLFLDTIWDVVYRLNIDIEQLSHIVAFLLNENSDILNFLANFDENIKKSLIIKGFDNNKELSDITNTLFYGNYREKLSHAIGSYLYIKKFIQRKGDERNVNTYLSGEDRCLLTMEGIFKNGNLYGITNSNIKYLGYLRNTAFANLLNIELTSEYSILPIETIIILFYLSMSSDKGCGIDEIIEATSIASDRVKIALEKFEEFSYVSFDYKEKKHSITPKGQIVLEYSFRDINILGTYCYGGIFYKSYTEKIKIYGKNWEDYLSTILFNVTLTLKYIRQELEPYKKKTSLKETINKIQELLNNDYLKADFLFFYNKLDTEGRKNLDTKLKENGLFELFTSMLGIKNFKKIASMSEVEFLNMAEYLNSYFMKYNNSLEYKILLARFVYMQDIDNILSRYELQVYIFGDYASVLKNKEEYQKRKKQCIYNKVNIDILKQIDEWIDDYLESRNNT